MTSDALLAGLCAKAYLPGATIEAAVDLAALVITTDESVIVAFRGTSNIQAWLRDLDTAAISTEKLGSVHRGFYNGATALWQKMELPSDRKIIFTGHSLGGALAAVLGGLRIVADERIDELITFGAPRPGYNHLRELWKDKTVRQYRRRCDPVPTVPFDLIAFPYKHIREPIQVGPVPAWWVRLLALASWNSILARLTEVIGDHDIIGYQEEIEGLSS